MKVLKECIRLKPDDATIPLLAAKLCMGSLHWVSGPRAASPVHFGVLRESNRDSPASHTQGSSEPQGPGLGQRPPQASSPAPQGPRGVGPPPGTPRFSFSWESAAKVDVMRWNWNSHLYFLLCEGNAGRKRHTSPKDALSAGPEACGRQGRRLRRPPFQPRAPRGPPLTLAVLLRSSRPGLNSGIA